MNNSEIRKHLRKGELAVATLEALGHVFGTDPDNSNREIWIAPVDPKDTLKELLEEIIKDGIEKGLKERLKEETAKAYLAGENHAKTAHIGPNWHLVKDMVGRRFRVKPESIPLNHPLRDFGPIHFHGVNYIAQSIQYERSETYTGYTISFEFALRPYHPQVVRLPLSCAAFQ
ncbi:hypothetical protein PssvBMR2_gp28 [Pseudomonas phage MR2]|uniref:Uncharacterized protein n=1 Tax=Pseudomonas phage MR2 TaxID=2711170 RepID=A0A6M3TA68_9CAUD|nr:hypothetical protein PssvBMR2_gp28 [Pseudomonas phage MR2]